MSVVFGSFLSHPAHTRFSLSLKALLTNFFHNVSSMTIYSRILSIIMFFLVSSFFLSLLLATNYVSANRKSVMFNFSFRNKGEHLWFASDYPVWCFCVLFFIKLVLQPTHKNEQFPKSL